MRKFNCRLPLLVALAVFLFGALTAFADSISPISYSMPNGGSGQYSYHDVTYSGTGNLNSDYAPLSGGLGVLTDQQVPSCNWYMCAASWVGWLDQDPTITFQFANPVAVSGLTLYVNAPNGLGGVFPPAQVILSMGGRTLSFDISQNVAPGIVALALSNLGLQGDSLAITLVRYQNLWVMLSEVTFEGNNLANRPLQPVPEPATFTLVGLGLAGLWRFRRPN